MRRNIAPHRGGRRAKAEALGDAADQGAAFTAQMARAADSNWDGAMVIKGPPDTVTIRAKAANLGGSIKEQKPATGMM